jgi:dTDP-4-dehydrorhamnose 3,5-epimerase
MKITPLEIKGAFLLEGALIKDNRGVFRELMKFLDLEDIENLLPWVQNNVSVSNKNSIRGIHYSLDLRPQNKLISCLNGSVRDFVVDIRRGSPTYGQFNEITLNSSKPTSVYIEGGLGHAFIAETDNCVVSYLLTTEYNASKEYGVNPFDTTININWNVTNYHISEKDNKSPNLDVAEKIGILPMILLN